MHQSAPPTLVSSCVKCGGAASCKPEKFLSTSKTKYSLTRDQGKKETVGEELKLEWIRHHIWLYSSAFIYPCFSHRRFVCTKINTRANLKLTSLLARKVFPQERWSSLKWLLNNTLSESSDFLKQVTAEGRHVQLFKDLMKKFTSFLYQHLKNSVASLLSDQCSKNGSDDFHNVSWSNQSIAIALSNVSLHGTNSQVIPEYLECLTLDITFIKISSKIEMTPLVTPALINFLERNNKSIQHVNNDNANMLMETTLVLQVLFNKCQRITKDLTTHSLNI